MPSDPALKRVPTGRTNGLARRAVMAASSMLLAIAATPALPQPSAPAAVAPPPGLPAGLGTATSVDAVIAVLGAGKPEPSSHLLLDVPQIAGPGRVNARARSTLPATGALILLRGRSSAPPAPGTAAAAPAAGPAVSQGPALLAALLVRSGQEASMNVRLDLDRTQSLTLLTYAQGRWFQTTREVKVGKLKADVSR